jgi:hypothetical protein
LHRSQQDSSRIFVGLTAGLRLLRREKGRWINAGKLPGIGVFRCDEEKQRFFPDSTFGAAFADGGAGVEVLASDNHGNVWLVATSEAGDGVNLLSRQPDESFQRFRTPFLRVPKTALYAVYPESDSASNREDGVVWYGGAEGLVRYDHNVPKNYAAPFWLSSGG